ncbi:MAG TPA: toll/interleukin-1 receptor domain-containing protein [Pyrinomonadaceae bacterium]|nr:toll/interleukin-1 receptor domain-containing protein [Pyrinomonadaceae bacterium]
MNHEGVSQRLSRIAESSPARLLLSASFWLRQRAFLLIAVCSGALIITLSPYQYTYADIWFLLSGAIQTLALWNLLIAAKGLAKVEIEDAIARVVEARVTKMLSAIKSGQRACPHSDALRGAVLPASFHSPPPIMIDMLNQVFREADEHKFESSRTIIRTYREEMYEDVDKIQYVSKIALSLGAIGLIIGILFSLRSGSMMMPVGRGLGSSIAEVVAQATGLLLVSLSAILASIEVLVISHLLVILLRKRQMMVSKNMEGAVAGTLSLLHEFYKRNVPDRDGTEAQPTGAAEAKGFSGVRISSNAEYDVFLSYAALNRVEANVIYNAVNDAGGKVFLAEKTLQPGEDFAEEIRKSLRSSREVWVLVSANSLSSDWVLTELGAAWVLEKKIVPILYRCRPEELPDNLRRRHCVDFHRLPELIDRTFG